jgi:hypothetical protein
VAGLS